MCVCICRCVRIERKRERERGRAGGRSSSSSSSPAYLSRLLLLLPLGTTSHASCARRRLVHGLSLSLFLSLRPLSRTIHAHVHTHIYTHEADLSLSLSLFLSLSLSWAVFYSSCAARLPYLCEATNENPAGGAPAVGLLPFLHTGVRLAAWGYNPSARCSMGPNFYLRLFFSFIPWLLFPRTFFLSLFFS